MLLGSFFFATMGTLAHRAGALWDWQVIAIVRSLFPLILVSLLAWKEGVRFVFLGPRSLWMRSIAGSVSLVATFYSFTCLPVADVFTITNMYPIWLAVLSWPLLGEAPSRYVWLSALCGLVGVYLIQGPRWEVEDFRMLFPVAASVCTAFAMIGLHRLKYLDTRAVVVHFSAVAFLFSLASFGLFAHTQSIDFQPDSLHLAQLCGVGLAATIGQLLLTVAFTAGDPAKVAVVGLMQVVFALIFEVLLTREVPGAQKLIGVALVIAPTAWLMLRRIHAAPDQP